MKQGGYVRQLGSSVRYGTIPTEGVEHDDVDSLCSNVPKELNRLRLDQLLRED